MISMIEEDETCKKCKHIGGLINWKPEDGYIDCIGCKDDNYGNSSVIYLHFEPIEKKEQRMNNEVEIIEAIRITLSNWKKPELKQRFDDMVKTIFEKMNDRKYMWLRKDSEWIYFTFTVQSIEDIRRVAELSNKFELKYHYNDDGGVLQFKIKDS